MHTDFGPGDETYDDNTEYLIDSLPEFMANSESSGNWKLYTPLANQFDEIEEDLRGVDRATAVQYADTIDQLKKWGELVDIKPRDGESKEHYRSRIIAKFQLNSCEGTARDILYSASTILNCNVRDIGYDELDAETTIRLTFPGKKIENSNLSSDEITNILHDLLPAGYEVAGQKRGTFTYLSESAYTGSYDSSNGGYDSADLDSTYRYGHDGLDSDGNPNDNGGTYAGIIS